MWKLIIQSPTTIRFEHQLPPGITKLGRRRDNDVVMDHPSVSRHHAQLDWPEGEGLPLISDLDSTNNTYINGRRVVKQAEVNLGDQIRIGNFLITVVNDEIVIPGETVQAISASSDTDAFQEILIQAVDHYAVLLHDLSNQLVVVSNLEQARDLIGNFIIRMLNADHSCLVLSQEIEELLDDLNPSDTVRNCVENKIPVAFNNTYEHPKMGQVAASNILAPVLVNRDLVAMLHIANYNDHIKEREESDLQFCVAVSHQAALTLQRLEFEEKLIHNALHDPVTGLPNRISLMNQLEYVIARQKRDPEREFSLFFIDIDNFKLINDSLGHMIGDKVLFSVADKLNTATRDVDLVVRFGGDEFAILYEGCADVPELTVIAQRLIEIISQSLIVDGRKIVLSISVGITVSSLGYHTPEDVIRDADIAMYQAKAMDDINLKFFDKSMHLELVNLLEVQEKLREAHKRGDFILQYQPIINLHSGRIVAVEALIRWNRPGGEMVLPGKFLPSMDTTGLLSSVESWVIQTACRQLAWLNRHFDKEEWLSLAINLSEKQIRQPNLFEIIINSLEENNIPPDLLWLEITEQSNVKNMEAAVSVFESFRSMGVKLCLDDFGTGYSTLGHLNTFPLDVLKIDKSFVQQVDKIPDRAKLVRTIIGLGKNLGLQIVAEGVETPEELAFLRETECDYAQGFLMSKSLGAEEIEALLRKNPIW